MVFDEGGGDGTSRSPASHARRRGGGCPDGLTGAGACSCAGPHGHRLLAIDSAHNRAFEDEIERGCEGIKPGWTRINVNYVITDTVREYVIGAVELVAEHGHGLLPDYRFDPHIGLCTTTRRRRSHRPARPAT
jgi:hypothetical protein